MKINILTLFPEMFDSLKASMLGRAIDNGIIELNIVNIRDYTEDKHKRVDDTPYGGGAGMVMQCQPILDAYRAAVLGVQEAAEHGNSQEDSFIEMPVLYMSPRGEQLSGEMARGLAEQGEFTILCGHYEGVDQRVLDRLNAREVTIGDYVLTGGELPAMVLIDTVARFIEGVLASEESVMDESVYSGLLEYPHYSKPRLYEGMEVPEILLSGNHKEIDLWRWEQALSLTRERRPDMFDRYVKGLGKLSRREKQILEKYL